MRMVCMIALAMYSCLAGQAAPAQASGYTDDEVKAQFVEAGMFCHAEFIRGGYRRAFEMAGCDTNRYARILRELAVENTNETEWAIASLGTYKTNESLPFLYSYATNAVYGAKALKAVFAIEGEPRDTFVDPDLFKKGVIFVNGMILSRYWEKGPQHTCYLPAPFLREGKNEIIVLELEGYKKARLSLIDQPILD